MASALVVSVVALGCSGRSVITASGNAGTDGDDVGAKGGNAGTAVDGGAAGKTPVPGGGGMGGSPDDSPKGGSSNSEVGCSVPPPSIRLKDWVEAESPESPDSAKARLIKGMIGDWFGVVSTSDTLPYEVTLSFAEDGTYSGECVWRSNECCVALYYGTDDDSDLKRYAIEGVTLDGAGYGNIDIIFSEPGNYYESGYQGALENVELDATLARMRFYFMYDVYGPIVFDLERTGEAPPK
jgi:hypothetical protein